MLVHECWIGWYETVSSTKLKLTKHGGSDVLQCFFLLIYGRTQNYNNMGIVHTVPVALQVIVGPTWWSSKVVSLILKESCSRIIVIALFHANCDCAFPRSCLFHQYSMDHIAYIDIASRIIWLSMGLMFNRCRKPSNKVPIYHQFYLFPKQKH